MCKNDHEHIFWVNFYKYETEQDRERERERRGVKNVFKIPPDFIIDRIFRGLTFYQRKEISKKEEKSSFDQGLSIALAVA